MFLVTLIKQLVGLASFLVGLFFLFGTLMVLFQPASDDPESTGVVWSIAGVFAVVSGMFFWVGWKAITEKTVEQTDSVSQPTSTKPTKRWKHGRSMTRVVGASIFCATIFLVWHTVILTDAMHFLGSFKNIFTTSDSQPFDIASYLKEMQAEASSGDAKAQNTLGNKYYVGSDVPKNEVEAVKWYRKAAEQGEVHSQKQLGFLYREGRGVPQDDFESLKWYRKAAEQGDADSQNMLGFMYDNGEGVPKNAVEAMKWYRKSAEQGHAEAQNNIGMMYSTGKGVARDDVEAVKLFREAAEQGLPVAQNNLGFMYSSGKGVSRDYVEGYAWYAVSAASGSETAKDNLPSIESDMSPEQIADGQELAARLFEQINVNKTKKKKAKLTP